MPTVGFGSSDYQTPGEALAVFGRVQTGAPFATVPTTTHNYMAGVAGLNLLLLVRTPTPL